MQAIPLSSRLCYDDFLSIDGPTGNALAPGDPRDKFFHHLGMDEGNRRHQMIYERMKSEAKVAMRRLFATRHSLDVDCFDDDTVEPPYTLEQISERAFQNQVVQVYRSASTHTKGIYDLVQTDDSNWVIRWMLCRVINAKVASRSSADVQACQASTSPTVTEVSACASIFSTALRASSMGTSDGYCDWEQRHKHGRVDSSIDRPPEHVPPGRKLYWDHVLGV